MITKFAIRPSCDEFFHTNRIFQLVLCQHTQIKTNSWIWSKVGFSKINLSQVIEHSKNNVGILGNLDWAIQFFTLFQSAQDFDSIMLKINPTTSVFKIGILEKCDGASLVNKSRSWLSKAIFADLEILLLIPIYFYFCLHLSKDLNSSAAYKTALPTEDKWKC